MTKAIGASILLDVPIQTDGKIKSNRPDIVIKDNKRKTCLQFNISKPADNNLTVKEYNE